MFSLIVFFMMNYPSKTEKGQDLAEYALLLLLIAVAVVAAATFLGQAVFGLFNSITHGMPF